MWNWNYLNLIIAIRWYSFDRFCLTMQSKVESYFILSQFTMSFSPHSHHRGFIILYLFTCLTYGSFHCSLNSRESWINKSWPMIWNCQCAWHTANIIKWMTTNIIVFPQFLDLGIVKEYQSRAPKVLTLFPSHIYSLGIISFICKMRNGRGNLKYS